MAEGDQDAERLRIILEMEAREAERTAKRYERSVNAIERRYDDTARASQRFEREQRQLNGALEAGTIDATRHAALMAQVTRGYEEATGAAGRAAQATGGMGAMLGRHRGTFQQAGYQVGDFAVQLQSGTSAITAFTQQGSQMLGAFGAYGAIAGAALAIGAPLAASFFRSGDEAEGAADKAEKLTEATDNYVDAAERARTPIADLRSEWGGLADDLQSVLESQEEVTRITASRALESRASELASQFGGLSTERGQRTGMGPASPMSMYEDSDRTQTLQSMQEDLGVTESQAQKLIRVLSQLDEARGPEAVMRTMIDLRDTMLDVAGGAEGAVDMFGDSFTNLSDDIEAARRQATTDLARIEKAASRYTGTLTRLRQLEQDRATLVEARETAFEQGEVDRANALAVAITANNDALNEMRGEGGDARREVERLSDRLDRAKAIAAEYDFDGDGGVRRQIATTRHYMDQLLEGTRDLDAENLSTFHAAIQGIVEQLESALGRFEDIRTEVTTPYEHQMQYQESRMAGRRMSRSEGRRAAAGIIRQHEGQRSEPYWDVNAYRAGYGSDTYTSSDGGVHQVQQGERVSIEDAERDLRRRIGTYFDQIIGEIGQNRFDALSADQQGSLASLLHNYGRGEFREGGDLGGVLSAVQSGRQNAVADAIGQLATHNGGINRSRRMQEAGAFGGVSAPVQGDISDSVQAASEEEQRIEDAARARERYAEQLSRSNDQLRHEMELMGMSAAEQAEATTRYSLMADAKRRGIDLDEQLANSGRTYLEVINEIAAAEGRRIHVQERMAEASDRAAERTRFFEAQNQAMRSGLVESIIQGQSFTDVLGGVAQALQRAALQASLFGQGPLAGGGALGGLMGAITGRSSDTGGSTANGEAMATPGSQGGSGGGGLWGSIVDGFRANGGPVEAGKSYVVGEKRPELFTPRQPGTIHPSVPTGGGGSATVNVQPRIINESQQQVETRQGSDGELEVIVRNIVRDDLASGGGRKVMRDVYGVRPTTMGGY